MPAVTADRLAHWHRSGKEPGSFAPLNKAQPHPVQRLQIELLIGEALLREADNLGRLPSFLLNPSRLRPARVSLLVLVKKATACSGHRIDFNGPSMGSAGAVSYSSRRYTGRSFRKMRSRPAL